MQVGWMAARDNARDRQLNYAWNPDVTRELWVAVGPLKA
jgi:hypothetical protein